MNADGLEAEDEILSFVTISDIASFRQTCRLAELFTRDRSLWLALLGCQRQWLPLPREAFEKASLHLLSSSRLEEIVSKVYYGQLRWLSKRTKALQLHGTPDDHSDILCLAYLLDSLVLGVYTNGAIALWDPIRSSTGRIDPISLWELWGREPWTSALACLDISGDAVYVVVSRTHSRVQNGSTTVLMRISLPSPYSQSYKSIGAQQAEQFDNESVLFGPDNQIARAIDPERRLLAFSRISFIEIVHWPTKTGISIDTQTADLEDLWNGIIGMRFVGPYLFCARTRSIELYDVSSPFLEGLQYSALPTLRPTASNPLTSQIPLRSKPLPPIASYMFPSLSLRTVSISAPFPPITKAGVTTTTLTFLANDVLRGLFHYRIDILVSSDSTPPSVDLQMHLIGAYTGLNGFVGAAALGQQSLRGVWIERSRNTTSRRVMAFTTSQQAFSAAAEIRTPDTATVMEPNDDDERSEDGELSSSDGIQPAASGEITLPIDGQTVYDIHSYDLREDLMHVAFSEVTGHIALGTRSGNVRII